jgi:hypothetical protein
MGNNNLKGTNDILVKTDQNNLIYIDPNSVLSNGVVYPRGVEPENLVMYVNLEADLIPRTTLIANGDTNSMTSIAGGSLNFLKNQNGRDYDATWTDPYANLPKDSVNFINTGLFNAPNNPSTNGGNQNDNSAQSFGIESISIQITGANFIPRVVIKFIDVRGKTLFESPADSPYAAFFHLPWPIFYLTVKGYYGKAIKYRLHLVKLNTRYEPQSGNLEVETNFVGSTYAYMADISLESILNAPYFYASESETNTQYNEKTKMTDITVSKSTKGYRILQSVYQEYKNLGLLPKDFPVKTLREIIIIAGRLNKLLEQEIFPAIMDPKLLVGIKEFEDLMESFYSTIASWKGRYLSAEFFVVPGRKRSTGEEIRWFRLSDKSTQNTLTNVVGPKTQNTLEFVITKRIEQADANPTFGVSRNAKLIKDNKLDVNPISFAILKDIKNFYVLSPTVGIDIDGIEDALDVITKNFVEQRIKMETDIEKQINQIVKGNDKNLGIGFEPTVRNIIGVILANADTYVRLMKDVHNKAFESATLRKKILTGVLTDSDKPDQCIYPWPEIKAQSAGKGNLILMYPGSREMMGKLQSDSKTLWPEVDFVENFYEVSTKKLDPLTGKEVDPENINYIFGSQGSNTIKGDISVLTNLVDTLPYTDKSFSSVLYEIFERAKYTTLLSPFSNDVMTELSNVEFDKNLKTQIIEDVDIINMLKLNVTNIPTLLTQMQGLSTFDRFPYFQDQLPTISYLKDGLSQDYNVVKYDRNIKNSGGNNNDYTKLMDFLLHYKAESYRTNIYPFNSTTYATYLGSPFTESNLGLNGMLSLNTPDDFIASPMNSTMWVKDGFTDNLFNNTIFIGGISKQILNTPYFHKQLYSDFLKSQSQEKYSGSAYLLLNSLPFKDLDENITYNGKTTLMSTLFREIGATHYIPYHMMLKWGSIYHRYKEVLNGHPDIIAGITVPIDGTIFYNNDSGLIYNSTPESIGFHPFYEDVFYQIINGKLFFDPLIQSGYTDTISSGITCILTGFAQTNAYVYSSFVDNSKINATDNRYTLLPTNGGNNTYGDDFSSSEQENFRAIWGIGTSDQSNINYSGYTFPSYNEYLKLTGATNNFSLSGNYRKVIDLIATFKPGILDVFEQAFLDFASEKLNEEISYSLYDVSYSKFQDLLKRISSVAKNSADSITDNIFDIIKTRQIEELKTLTTDILSNNNFVKIIMSNPRETDAYVLGGFTGVNVKNFSVDAFDSSQIPGNNIELYLGEDIDGYYLDFFSVNNVALTDENILQFRPIIYIYAGLRSKGISKNKTDFIEYLKENIISYGVSFDPISLSVISTKNTATGVGGQDVRLSVFLNNLITRIGKDLQVQNAAEASKQRGYNDDPAKLELYNYFKSFNDKWTAGNSIGQRTLMEEFLFLDRANRDIGDSVYIDMQKLTQLSDSGNKKINLFSAISLLVQDTGFDIRALPAYINFYGTNYTSSKKTIPSKNVARNMFGTFLEIDYQDSSPKIILQYVGPTSKHLQLSDIDKKQKFKDDGFDISNPHNNPVIVAPDVFTKTDFTKSNKVVAFEVSFGDQNQSIFKGVELDQATLKNTSESFQVLERLGRNETGSSTAQIDIGLFEIYRSASYQCQVTAMGNMMIQPTMYFYLKNVPLFRGSYLITEVTHNIKTTGIETMFKGTRIPAESLPDPKDSFLASYRSLFDKIINRAQAKVSADAAVVAKAAEDGKKQTIVTPQGSYSINVDNLQFPGERIVKDAGLTEYGVPYNGFDSEENIQLITFNSEKWLRTKAVLMGGKNYPITDGTIDMNIVTRLKTGGKNLQWEEVKGYSSNQFFYSSDFDINRKITPDDLIYMYAKTEFLNPTQTNPLTTVKTNIDVINNRYEGPITVGPSIDARMNGYGIGMSDMLMKSLGLKDGDIVYFRLTK